MSECHDHCIWRILLKQTDQWSLLNSEHRRINRHVGTKTTTNDTCPVESRAQIWRTIFVECTGRGWGMKVHMNDSNVANNQFLVNTENTIERQNTWEDYTRVDRQSPQAQQQAASSWVKARPELKLTCVALCVRQVDVQLRPVLNHAVKDGSCVVLRVIAQEMQRSLPPAKQQGDRGKLVSYWLQTL